VPTKLIKKSDEYLVQ
jgi:hypothetical protein